MEKVILLYWVNIIYINVFKDEYLVACAFLPVNCSNQTSNIYILIGDSIEAKIRLEENSTLLFLCLLSCK